MAKVFSQKHSLTIVGNVGINNVGTESVYQIVQSGRTECLTGLSRLSILRSDSCDLHMLECEESGQHGDGCVSRVSRG